MSDKAISFINNSLPLTTIMLIRNFLFFGIIYLFKVDYDVKYADNVMRNAKDKNKKCTVPLEKDTARKLLTDIGNESRTNFFLFSIVWILAFAIVVCTILIIGYRFIATLSDPDATNEVVNFINFEARESDEYYFVYILRFFSQVINILIMKTPIIVMTILQERTLIFIMAILVIDVMRRIHLTQQRLKKISETQADDIKAVAEAMSQKKLFEL